MVLKKFVFTPKIVVCFYFIGLFFSTSLTLSHKSHAIVGTGAALMGIPGASALAWSGLISSLIGGMYIGADKLSQTNPSVMPEARRKNADLAFFVGIPFSLFGVVLLDQDTQIFTLSDLSEHQFVKQGLSDSEARAFKQALPEINAVIEDSIKKISQLDTSTVAEASLIWSQNLNQLDQDTLKSLVKLIKTNLK